jgi:molecular chaperone GrpE
MSEEEAVEGEPSETPAEVTDGAAEETSASSADAEAGDESASTGDEPASTLVDRVGEHDEALAREVAELEAALESSREETSELTSKLARVRADFSNYKERAKRKREEIRERASEALVEKVVPVRNDLLRALDQEEGSDIRPGVESTLEKFDQVLTEEGVDPIRPEPGDEVDPNRHQVMLRVESEQPNGTIHEVYEPGYEMGDRVLTEAQVTVSADDDA